VCCTSYSLSLDILSPDKPVLCAAPVTACLSQYFNYLHA